MIKLNQKALNTGQKRGLVGERGPSYQHEREKHPRLNIFLRLPAARFYVFVCLLGEAEIKDVGKLQLSRCLDRTRVQLVPIWTA